MELIEPSTYKMPLMIEVKLSAILVPEANVTALLPVEPVLLIAKLLNVVAVVPPIVWADVPLKVTVPLLAAKVAPLLVQLPETFNCPDDDDAVKVPLFKVSVVVLTIPLEPVKVPPEMVRPPLSVWVLVEAAYVPVTVVKPATVVAKVFALKVPLETVKAPLTIRAACRLVSSLDGIGIVDGQVEVSEVLERDGSGCAISQIQHRARGCA